MENSVRIDNLLKSIRLTTNNAKKQKTKITIVTIHNKTYDKYIIGEANHEKQATKKENPTDYTRTDKPK